MGTPARSIIFLLSLFEPIYLIAEAGGPTKVRPFDSIISTKSAFSDKKPYLKVMKRIRDIQWRELYLPRVDGFCFGILDDFE